MHAEDRAGSDAQADFVAFNNDDGDGDVAVDHYRRVHSTEIWLPWVLDQNSDTLPARCGEPFECLLVFFCD